MPRSSCSGASCWPGGNCSIRRSTGAMTPRVISAGPSARSSAAGLVAGAGAQQVADAARGVLLAGGGALQQLGQLVRQLALQPVFEEVAEQVVQPQRQLRAFERADEQAAFFDFFQPARGARVQRHRHAAAGAELGQHRAAQQEQPQFGRHALQHLGRQVVEDMPVQRRRAQRGRGRAAVADSVFSARRRPTAQPCVRAISCAALTRWAAAGVACSSASTSLASNCRSLSRNSASSPCTRSRASASGGASRPASTSTHCGGRPGSSRSRNSKNCGSLTRCRSSKTMTPRGSSQAASVLSSSSAASRRWLRVPAARTPSASGSERQGGSKGSSAAHRQASRRCRSSSSSQLIQASALPAGSRAICRVSAAVLPKPAGAVNSSSRCSCARGHRGALPAPAGRWSPGAAAAAGSWCARSSS